ncbi:MAG: GNAT family N-acetyltransferase [Eubacteriales bacterium]|nr:GNAT family N-acetyltransferase [Eubacteriales bacterium]
MVELCAYEERNRDVMLPWISAFFGFHAALVGKDADAQEMQSTLEEWLRDGHELYVITADGTAAGFVHLGFRGDTVAWLEDLFVTPALRGQGIATRAIACAEALVSARPGCTALCIDVAPRNEAALRLYRALGYDALSLLTLRKEFGPDPRDRQTQALGMRWRY